MADSNIKYRKLGRLTLRQDSILAGSATRASLYQGPDHLLLLEKVWFKETYRRFYYKDIQAFLLQKTKRGLWWNTGLFVGALLFIVFALAASGSGADIFFFCVAGFLLFCLFINWILGPTCRCYVKTAVQYEELPPLNRKRKAEAALAALRQEIEAVQGHLQIEPEATAVPSFSAEPSVADTTWPAAVADSSPPPAAELPTTETPAAENGQIPPFTENPPA